MSGPEGYKGADIKEKGGIDNIPISKDSKAESKDDLGKLKQEIDTKNVQLNIKIEETFDTFEELSKTKLTEEQRKNITKLLLESSKNAPSQKLFLDKVLLSIKDYGSDVKLEDFNEITETVLIEENVKKGADKIGIKVEKKEDKFEQTDTAAKQTDTAAKQTESKIEITEKTTKNLKELKTSLLGLNKDNVNYKDILEKLDGIDLDKIAKEGGSEESDKKINEVLEALKDPPKLKFIFEDLQKQDEQNGTNNYEKFRNSLISIDRSFIPIIEGLEDTNTKAKIFLGIDNIYGVDIGKNILRKKTDDGYNVEFGKDGRTISVDGSEYKIESKLNNQKEINQMKETDNRYKNDLSKLNEELNTLYSIMDYVDDAIANNVELSVVKQTIKLQNVNLYNEMNLDSLTSLEQVKNAFVVMIKQKDEEKEKKIKEKKRIIDEIVRQNALNAKEIDEKKKEILKFLHQIKFDMLPKDLTDQIINEFKSNIFSIPGVNLNKDTIDIANGKFGEGVNETGGDRWKDNLVKFMEKMIYGQIGAKESIFNGKQFKGELGANIDPLVINTALEQNGLKTELGWNINTIRDNLKKENTKK